jgi:DNA-binding CsgD family transcriptional regulator
MPKQSRAKGSVHIDRLIWEALTRSSSFGRYAELYPNLPDRVQAIMNLPDPKIRQRLKALGMAFARRNERHRAWLPDKYGLTPAETRIAIYLARGGSIASFAQEFGVSKGTVRTHLKAIFAKTGVRRQVALATLITGRPAGTE